MSEKYISTQRWAWTADGKLVLDTDTTARSLFCIVGAEIPMEHAVLLGLVPKTKEAAPVETKEARPEKTKGRGVKAEKR